MLGLYCSFPGSQELPVSVGFGILLLPIPEPTIIQAELIGEWVVDQISAGPTQVTSILRGTHKGSVL